MPQLDFANYPFLSQFFWLFTSFIILYIAAAKVILPRISHIIEMRDSTINNALKEAEELRNKAESSLQNYESALDNAKSEARNIIEQAQQKSKIAADKAIKKLDTEIATQIADTEKRITQFTAENKDNVKKLSEEIYQNLIKKYSNV